MRYLTPVLFAVAATVLSTAPAHADLGDQLFKLLPDDGGVNHQFGWSVAVSGNTAMISAHGQNDFTGAVYLFNATTGQQLFKLLADDGAPVDLFGWFVAISGNTAIVAALGDDDNGPSSGSAYLFDISDPANPIQLFKLLADDGAGNDWFGSSVGISGTTAIVGASRDDDNGSNSGSAYLFDTTTGEQLFKLLPDDGTENAKFGFSVGISGTTAIVGTPSGFHNGIFSGVAYLFDTTTGQQISKLVAKDAAAFDSFGQAVAMDGSIAIVGAGSDDDNGPFSGSAYLFDTTTGQQLFKLLPEEGFPAYLFGTTVAISGTTAIIGSYGFGGSSCNRGAAYFFNTTTGQQLFNLLPDDSQCLDEFGRHEIGISGDIAIVGAWGNDDNGSNSGSAYLFDAGAPGMCPWDLDNNGVVGASDLLALLVSWGPCKGCPADFDGNGTVGASDLLALLVNWGPCP